MLEPPRRSNDVLRAKIGLTCTLTDEEEEGEGAWPWLFEEDDGADREPRSLADGLDGVVERGFVFPLVRISTGNFASGGDTSPDIDMDLSDIFFLFLTSPKSGSRKSISRRSSPLTF